VSRIYTRAAAFIAFLGAASLACGLAAGAAWGWGMLAALLAATLAYHVHQLARLGRWLAKPLPGEVPEARGEWDEVLHGLHRHERDAARDRHRLSETLSRFRRAAEALPEGVVILDAANRIEWCNDTAAAHLGLDARADVGQHITNLVREPEFAGYVRGAGSRAPVRLRFGSDETLYALQLIAYGEAQKLLLSRDVTQAERVETMRRDFVANVSHELRTPLTVLVGFLETVRELKLDPQRTRDYLGMMQEQAARMHRIIEDLLVLSQLESAPPPPSERVQVLPLLQRVRGDAEALSAGRHRIVLDAQPAVDLLGVDGELASAFGNLVTNAVRYTPSGGEVRIEWREELDGGARFAVADTGVGIAAEHLPRLTERFYRVDRSRSRETGGTGLGLAIVKHALARHDAKLGIESAPAQGSRFTVYFPPKRTCPATTPQEGTAA
jgi:two-component system, OmpR family, phosphate regulon sensor histidine kinase PhoR